MKRTLFIAALFTVALAVSCQPKEAIEEPLESSSGLKTFTLKMPDTDSRVSVDLAGKVSWEAGDKIHIHTGHNRDGEAVTVELKASDISADGKTAVITIEETLKPYDFSSWGEGYCTYYAAYPAEATNNPSSCYSRNYFSDTNRFLMAAGDDNGTFEFHNLCGIITFTATGAYDSYVFSSNSGEFVSYDNYVVEIIPGKNPNYMYKATAGGQTKVAGEFKSGEVTYVCIPNGANLTGGFSIMFMDGEEVVSIAKSVAPLDVPRGSMLNLGDISGHIKPYTPPTESDHKSSIPLDSAFDLSAGKGPANCYMLSEKGTYKFPAVKGNSDELAGNVFGVELLWETYCTADDVIANSIIGEVDFENNWIVFKTPDNPIPGNALIAAKDSQDKIIWSWHIWLPATGVSTWISNTICGAQMMDRNLGALVETNSGAVSTESFGMLYQWGRKDPFPSIGSMDSSSQAKVAGAASSVIHEQTSVGNAISHPTTLYNFNDSDWLATSDDNLWSNDSNKSIYDPCPPGYKVPSEANASEIMSASDLSTLPGWAISSDPAYFTLGSPDITLFPMGGYIDDYSESFKLSKVGVRVAIWMAKGSGQKGNAIDVRIDKGTQVIGSPAKSRAAYVRCVLEPQD